MESPSPQKHRRSPEQRQSLADGVAAADSVGGSVPRSRQELEKLGGRPQSNQLTSPARSETPGQVVGGDLER